MRLYIGYTGTDDVPVGFTNNDIIESAPGATLNIDLQWSNVVHPSVINNGIMMTMPGSTLNLNGPGSLGAPLGFIYNTGEIIAWGGTVSISANFAQSDTGSIQAINGGTIDLYAGASYGSAVLVNATLAFKQEGLTAGPGGPSYSSGRFGATLSLEGWSDLIDFGRSDISIDFNASANTLAVSVPWSGHGETQIANIQLSGRYNASEFSVQGNDVVFTQRLESAGGRN